MGLCFSQIKYKDQSTQTELLIIEDSSSSKRLSLMLEPYKIYDISTDLSDSAT